MSFINVLIWQENIWFFFLSQLQELLFILYDEIRILRSIQVIWVKKFIFCIYLYKIPRFLFRKTVHAASTEILYHAFGVICRGFLSAKRGLTLRCKLFYSLNYFHLQNHLIRHQNDIIHYCKNKLKN